MGFIFLVSAILAFFGAVMMVSRRNAVYSLLFLLVSFIGSAGLFYSLTATFIAIAQVLVYAGAIAVIFLFVLMFVDMRREGETNLPSRIDSLATYDPDTVVKSAVSEGKASTFSLPALLFSAVVFLLFAFVIIDLPKRWDSFEALSFARSSSGNFFGGVKAFGEAMMRDFPLHFEVVGLVIVVGVIGAVVLGQRLKPTKKITKGEE